MKYMLLIYGDQGARVNMTEQDQQAEMAAYFAFNADAQGRGVLLSQEALYPATTATTVRVRESKTLTTDGPFAETREQLGGFYILDCPSLDDAIEWAAKIPGVDKGSVEIRPLVVFG